MTGWTNKCWIKTLCQGSELLPLDALQWSLFGGPVGKRFEQQIKILWIHLPNYQQDQHKAAHEKRQKENISIIHLQQSLVKKHIKTMSCEYITIHTSL